MDLATPIKVAGRSTLLSPGKVRVESAKAEAARQRLGNEDDGNGPQTKATLLGGSADGLSSSNKEAAEYPHAHRQQLQDQQQHLQRDIYTIQCQPRNEELQASVKNSCGAIYPLQEELKVIMREWQSRWNSWAEDNAKQVRVFDEELTYFSKKPYESSELDESYPCHLKSEWLDKYLMKVKALQKASEEERRIKEEKEASAKARQFDGLSKEEIEILQKEIALVEEEEQDNQPPLSPNTQRKAAASNHRRVSFAGIHEDLARLFFGPVKRSNITNTMEDVNNTLFPFDGHELVKLTMQTHDNGQADPLSLLRAEFSKSLAAVAANETQLTKMADERDSFITQERVSEAEEKTREMIDLFTDTLHIVYSRFKQAITAGIDVREFVDHVADVALGTLKRSDDARKEAEETQEKGQQDLKSLREYMKKARESARQSRELFESRRGDSDNKLKTNTSAQQHAWATILNELQHLKELCVEREALIGDRMLATENEQERLRHTAEVDEICVAREDDLLAVLDNARQALEYVDSVDKLSETIQASVREKDFPERLRKYQIEEGLRFSDVYKRYALFAGRTLFLRQQRLENIRRLVRATEFQMQSATETLDADLPLYRSQLATYKTTEDTLQNETSSLSNSMGKEESLWEEVENFLDEQQVVVEAPASLAVQELQRDLMKSHVQAVDALASTEQKLLDSDKAHVRRIHNACVAAKEVIQEKHRHRSTIHAANSSPISPSEATSRSGAAVHAASTTNDDDDDHVVDVGDLSAIPSQYSDQT